MGILGKLLKSNRGETLLVAIISAALLLSVFMLSAPAIVNHLNGQKKQFAEPNLCQNHVSNVINRIRANGVQTKVYRVPINENSVSLNNSSWRNNSSHFNNINPGGVKSEEGLSSSLESSRWPNVRAMKWNDSSKKFIAHSPLLISGSMNLLSTIYNSYTSEVCGQPFGKMIYKNGPLYSLLNPESMDDYGESGYEVVGSLRIRPFNFKTGQIVPCQSPLKIRPYANMEPPESHQMLFTDFSNYKPEFGFEVEVFGSVAQKSNIQVDPEVEVSNQPNCSVVERFQYDLRPKGPKAPKVKIDGSGVEINVTNVRSGTFLACTYSASRKLLIGYQAMPSWTRNYWGPCDTIEVCGQPGSVDIEDNKSTLKIKINKSFPSNCLMSVKAIAFDGIGNASNTGVYTHPSGTGPTVVDNGPDNGDSGQGYEVGGVEFGSLSAAQQAASLTGLSVNTLSYDVTTVNDSRMSSFSGSMNATTDALGAAASALGAATTSPGLSPGSSVSSASAAVSSAQAAVSAADAAVSAAAAATSAASNMGAMGVVGEVAAATAAEATQAAADAKAAAEAALAAAEAALAAAEAAEADDSDE